MSIADPQRRRVYLWEDREVAPRDLSMVPFQRLQGLVDFVWVQEGLSWAPLVRPLTKKARRTVARATRLAIEAPEQLATWVLLHELAHCMSSTAEERSDGHGPIFVGLYLKLLVDYARMPRDALEASLRKARIEWDPAARAVFVE
jgi:hypothetical protein